MSGLPTPRHNPQRVGTRYLTEFELNTILMLSAVKAVVSDYLDKPFVYRRAFAAQRVGELGFDVVPIRWMAS